MKAIKFFAAALAVAFAVSCAPKGENVKVDVELPTAAEVDSVSYLIGINFGSFIKGNNFAENLSDLNMSQIKKGIIAFLEAEGNPYEETFGEQFDINPNEMGRILNGYLTKKMEYKKAVNKIKEDEFLAKNKLKENVDTTASGLQYTIIEEGAAEKIGRKDTVWVNYKGTLLDGEVFDENDSTKFIADRMISGFTEGLTLLGEGGKATLYIPANLAYGENGNQRIEPNSTLIFDVEILTVKKFIPKQETEEKKGGKKARK